jgi:hypothetical protein
MKIHEPTPHWNNFTVPELKEILEHCKALERLGIAQDEEMMISISRDIALREKRISEQYLRPESKFTKITLQTAKQKPQDYLYA